MRADIGSFKKFNIAPNKEPRYVIELSFDLDNTDIYYFTSHDDAQLPAGASSLLSVIDSISGTSQRINPDEARAEIGAINIKLIDDNSDITSLIANKLAGGDGLRNKRLRVYVGYDGLDWTEYVLIQTQIVREVSFSNGSYTISCNDIQRSIRKDIFTLAETNLTSTIDEDDTTINVVSTSSFTTLVHGTSYSDAPSTTVGYIKIDDEVIRYTGTTSTSFTGCVRGVLNTKAAIHESDITVSNDKKTLIQEYVYLELPALKLAYAILTGVLYGESSPDSTLPDNWHLNISESLVYQSDFLNFPDIWDTSDDSAGIILRFEGLDKQDAKKFIEEQILFVIGCFSPIYADGTLGIKKMSRILSDAPFIAKLDESNIVSYSDLVHDKNSIINQIKIKWNWNNLQKRYTRTNLLIDSESISMHGLSDPLEIQARGLHGSRHSVSLLNSLFDFVRDRYAGPPERITVSCLPSLNSLEVGDVVRVTLSSLRDAASGSTINRSFEIQNIRTDWLTGNLSLELFGSTQLSSEISLPDSATVLPDAFYTSAGSEIENYLSASPLVFETSGGIGHIIGDCELTGNASMTASGAIYYYDGDLQIDSGVTVTITDNVQLRIKGDLTVNGTITGLGNGLPGGSGATTVGSPTSGLQPWRWQPDVSGTSGFLGNTESQRGLYISNDLADNHNFIVDPFIEGQYPTFPRIEITYDSSSGNIIGIPSDMRGSSGSGGGQVSIFGDTGAARADGGDGGSGGAALTVICRSLSAGGSGEIILDGADGEVGDSYFHAGSGKTVYGGAGSGGAPGAFLLLLDGNTATYPDFSNFLSCQVGAMPVSGVPISEYYAGQGPPFDYAWFPNFPEASDYISGGMTVVVTNSAGGAPVYDDNGGVTNVYFNHDISNSAYRIIYIPDYDLEEEDVSLEVIDPPTDLIIESGTDHLITSLDGTIISRIYASWTASPYPFQKGYRVEYKVSSDSNYTAISSLTPYGSTYQYISPVKDGEYYDIRVKLISRNGSESDWLTLTTQQAIGKTEPPPDVTTFLVTRFPDGTRQFKWTLLNPPVDLAGYKIRYALSSSPQPDWEDMTDLQSGILLSSPFETNQLAAGTYTAAIKAVDTSGNESDNALFITSTLGDPRLRSSLLIQDEADDGWPGTKTDCWVDNNNYLIATDQKTWADFATDSPQITWADWTSWARDPNSPIVYETDIIDTGVITSFTPLVTVSGQGTIVVEERHADSITSPETFSSYTTTGTLISGRYVQFKVTVTNASGLAQLWQMYINLDSEIVEEYLNDIDTSAIAESPTVAGDFRLPIVRSYALITNVQIALQNTGAGWSWELIDKSVSLGPRIKIYNSSDVLADATIDAIVKGIAG